MLDDLDEHRHLAGPVDAGDLCHGFINVVSWSRIILGQIAAPNSSSLTLQETVMSEPSGSRSPLSSTGRKPHGCAAPAIDELFRRLKHLLWRGRRRDYRPRAGWGQ